MIPDLFEHQAATVEKLTRTPVLFDMSDAGTGKTRAHLQAFWNRRQTGGGKLLVLATKSTLQSAWGNDIDKFFPGMTYSVAYAHNREKAFMRNTDVYITNHDAVKWVVKHSKYIDDVDTLIVDESTAFKNPQTERSKALLKLSKLSQMQFKELMTGTPNPNTVLELWHQMLVLDGGQRLGASYWKFRNAVCEPVQVGPRPEHIDWRDKPGVEAALFDLIADVSIRHEFTKCTSIPENFVTAVRFDLSPKALKAYEQMAEAAIAEINGNEVTAIHAASVTQKLLQIAAGAVYSDLSGNYEVVDEQRTELVMDLVEERKHCLVAFLWKHQKELLTKEAEKRGMKYAVIDGSVPALKRTEIVDRYQAGELKVVFAHPQSAGHGLTMTKGTSTIWASPTWNSEWYEQFNHRIYRTGQTERTETVHVCANDTLDERVYSVLHKKVSNMELLRELMEAA